MPPKQKGLAAGHKIVAQNRKARHDYEILQTVEAGIVLAGSEVKSMRAGGVQLRDAYARVDGDELWLFSMHVIPYEFANGFGAVDPDRRRKLLLHRREIEDLGSRVARDHLALIPVALYFKDGRAKVELALGRGRRTYDKRHAIAKRDADRDLARSASVRRRD